MLLLLRQKLKLVTSNSKPEATSKVKVIVGVPPELLSEMACPLLPVKEVHALLLFVQLELDKLASKTVGVTVYGCELIEVVPKSC